MCYNLINNKKILKFNDILRDPILSLEITLMI